MPNWMKNVVDQAGRHKTRRQILKAAIGGAAGLVLYLVFLSQFSDVMQYVAGRSLGRRKVLPRVSPNKSVEGSLGSFAFSTLAAVMTRSFLPAGFNFSIGQVALMGAFFGGIGQLGDLSESLIKRDCQVKDSGKILPGMGGVLDVIDSLLFCAPAFYLYMSAALNTI